LAEYINFPRRFVPIPVLFESGGKSYGSFWQWQPVTPNCAVGCRNNWKDKETFTSLFPNESYFLI
jgi:hypothetical protein